VKIHDNTCNPENGRAEQESAVPVSVTRFIQTAGISQVTFWRWEKKGMIQTVRVAGRKYITPAALAEFQKRLSAGEFAGTTKNPRANASKK